VVEISAARIKEYIAQSEFAGSNANDSDKHYSVEKVANQIGESLKQIHGLDPKSLDQNLETHDWQYLNAKAEAIINSNEFDPKNLAAPYSKYTADELLTNLKLSIPDTCDLVPSHGNPITENFWFKKDELTGISGLETMALSDPVWDLAVTHLSIQESLGAAVVFAMYDGYGKEPSVAKLDHCIFLINILNSTSTKAAVI